MPLKRKQIYLDLESDRALKRLARSTRLSEAEHIRRAVATYVRERTISRNPPKKRDPLLDLIGIGDNPDAPRDAALHHDKYLYGRSR